MQSVQSRALVLASTSPFRKELLQRLRLVFETCAPDVDELRDEGEPAELLVRRLSEQKARAVADAWPDALIIGSDQVAVSEGDILGKPGNHENAAAQLARLAGRRVRFLTGLCLLDTRSGVARVDVIPYDVLFRKLTEVQIERYLLAEQPYNCAGSFKSEGLGVSLFEAMQGDDPSALIGLPLIRLVSWFNDAGVAVP